MCFQLVQIGRFGFVIGRDAGRIHKADALAPAVGTVNTGNLAITAARIGYIAVVGFVKVIFRVDEVLKFVGEIHNVVVGLIGTSVCAFVHLEGKFLIFGKQQPKTQSVGFRNGGHGFQRVFEVQLNRDFCAAG